MSQLCELAGDRLEHLSAQAVMVLARQIEQRDQAIEFKDAKLEKITTLFALGNLWMVRTHVAGGAGMSAPAQYPKGANGACGRHFGVAERVKWPVE
jgi:hypothetical protein